MTQIKAYILSVVAVSLLCCISKKIYPSNGASKQLITIICGMLMLITIAKPLFNLSFSDPTYWIDWVSTDASKAVGEGEQQMILALKEGIKQRAETYILDKAAAYGAQIDVQIRLSNDDLPVPVGSVIVGDVSPYVKTQLQYILQKEFGIAAKEQIWK